MRFQCALFISYGLGALIETVGNILNLAYAKSFAVNTHLFVSFFDNYRHLHFFKATGKLLHCPPLDTSLTIP